MAVHCRTGSLEINVKFRRVTCIVHCRTGSLETNLLKPNSRHPFSKILNYLPLALAKAAAKALLTGGCVDGFF